jgi:hypothetical protein
MWPQLPKVLPNFFSKTVQEYFINVQFLCETFDQGLGWRGFPVALPHQVLHRHLQLLSQIRERPEFLDASCTDLRGELVGGLYLFGIF